MAYAIARFDATDEAGNLLTDVTVEVRRETGGLQAVFADREGTVTIGSRFVSDTGRVQFYAPGNAYRIRLTKGAFIRELRYFAVGLAAESDMVIRNFRGEWNGADTYRTFEMVTHDGIGFFVSTMEENSGNQPDAATPASTPEWTFWGQEAPTGWKSVAELVVTGGTADEIEAMTFGGIDPAAVVLYVMKPALTNTGPVAINGTPLLTFDGAEMEAGYLPAGAPVLIEVDTGGDFRLAMDHRFQALADYARSQAEEAEYWAGLSQQVALPDGIINAAKVSNDPAQQAAIRAKIGAIAISDVTPALAALQGLTAISAFRIADIDGRQVGFKGGFADPFDDDAGIDPAVSSNYAYDVANDRFMPTVVTSNLLPVMTAQNSGGVIVSDSASTSTTYLVSDGNDATNITMPVSIGWIRFDFGSGNSKAITEYVLRNRNNDGNASYAPTAWTLEGSNDNSAWTTVDTRSAIAWASYGQSQTFSIGSPQPFRYWRLNVSNTTNPGGGFIVLSNMQLRGVTSINNMTLTSDALALPSVPAAVRVLVEIYASHSVTVNTDFKLSGSRNDGGNWTDADLTQYFGNFYEAVIDVSDQPGGDDLRLRFQSFNNKNVGASGWFAQVA